MKTDYKTEFLDAIERSERWGLSVPSVSLSDIPVLSEPEQGEAVKIINQIFSNYRPEDVSQQCFGIMLYLQPFLEEIFRKPLYYTLGYIQYNHRPVFFTPCEVLKEKMVTPFTTGGSFNLHAWLTTPNLEIIDLTFGTTFGVVTNNPDTYGLSSMQHYSKFDERMIYHPQLVGEDYLRKCGGLIEF
ncbi:hypothetical protein [Providencia rettgeri]|uniref:hypothetical protein n=1 Tax=Providencia rettgeri TaxID=587 RepID=UPI00301A704B